MNCLCCDLWLVGDINRRERSHESGSNSLHDFSGYNLLSLEACSGGKKQKNVPLAVTREAIFVKRSVVDFKFSPLGKSLALPSVKASVNVAHA